MTRMEEKFVEFEKWNTIKRYKFLTFDFEFNGQHRSHWTTAFFGGLFRVLKNSSDLRVLEQRDVKVHGFAV